MKKHKRIVVKVGTKVITSKDKALDIGRIDHIVFQLSEIMTNDIEVILVTSGAIGAGMSLLNMKKRPADLSLLQSTAAIGQNYLMHLYSKFFKKYFKKPLYLGQILLTQEDFNDRKRYLNIKHTIEALLKHRAIPIINENDTVATDEIRCGDNDRLSSLVADLCQADRLIILTDVDGLLNEDGKVISIVDEITPQILMLGGRSHCDLGIGGMATKIEAAKTVTQAGIECVIANGKEKDILYRMVIQSEALGTIFRAGKGKIMARKRWIAFSSKPKGAIRIDDGAKIALLKKDKSLLASGILGVDGNFVSGDVVKIIDCQNKEVARGLVNYSSDDISKIKGLRSSEFEAALGREGRDEVIHKDNLVLL